MQIRWSSLKIKQGVRLVRDYSLLLVHIHGHTCLSCIFSPSLCTASLNSWKLRSPESPLSKIRNVLIASCSTLSSVLVWKQTLLGPLLLFALVAILSFSCLKVTNTLNLISVYLSILWDTGWSHDWSHHTQWLTQNYKDYTIHFSSSVISANDPPHHTEWFTLSYSSHTPDFSSQTLVATHDFKQWHDFMWLIMKQSNYCIQPLKLR